MITPEDIIIRETNRPRDFTRLIHADLHLRHGVELSEFAFRSAKSNSDILQMAYASAGRGIWHKCYGELDKELHLLRREVMRDLPYVRPEIDEHFTKLRSMIRPIA